MNPEISLAFPLRARPINIMVYNTTVLIIFPFVTPHIEKFLNGLVDFLGLCGIVHSFAEITCFPIKLLRANLQKLSLRQDVFSNILYTF